jgi:ribonuclease G
VADIAREMLISHDPNETRVAIVEDDALVEFYVERSKRSVVGNVYLGRVKDVLPGMEAAFVDIGLEKNGFLYVDEVVAREGVDAVPSRDIQSLLQPGQEIVVQVLKDPMGTKGARITTDVALPGRFIVLMPYSHFVGVSRKLPTAERDRLHEAVQAVAPEGMGVIVRTAAVGVGEKEIEGDLEFLLRLWKRVSHQAREGLAPEVVYTEMDLALRMVRDVFSEDFRRLVVDDKQTYEKISAFLKKTSPTLQRRVSQHKEKVALFDYYSLQEQLEAAMRRRVWLPSGGYIAIDATEALTAVDVNTARFVGKRSLEETILRTNLEAAAEVVRQLRLRDIGGIIVVDFIDMERPENRERVMRRLRTALEKDRAKTRVMEMSPLGLVELTRKNVSDGPFTVLSQACPACQGEGRVLSDASRRIMIERRMREILRAGRSEAYLFGLHPDSLALVNRPGANLGAVLKAETGKHVAFVEDEACGPAEVCVMMEGRVSALRERPG